MSHPLGRFFVYGTLKRGEINHGLLAPHARQIDPAWVRGVLYDVGEFPALVDGPERVHGELIWVDVDAVLEVLPTLDRLEGCNPADAVSSMYHRRVVTAVTTGGRLETAYAYFYNSAHPGLPPLELLRAVEGGRWSGTESIGPVDSEDLDRYRRHVRQYADLSEQP